MWYNNKNIKNYNKDKINNIISLREPKVAENLVSKNYLLSPMFVVKLKIK